jgi:hypothetical protein
MDIWTILQNEITGSVNFFLHFTNQQSTSRGFGLTVDSTKTPERASIASVGYALTAWVIAVERGILTHQQARDITAQTLNTLLNHASHHRGFFAHFLHMDSAKRYRMSEYSTIDTAICLNGVITAAAYFCDAEITQLSQQLLERVDWRFLIFERDGKLLFRMAYNPDITGDYVTGQPGFISQWDMAAEQKMMYLQAAAHVEPAVARQLYAGFTRDAAMVEGQKLIINPPGSLYAYQCSEAWLDVGTYLDPDGIDWFTNLRLAALASRSFCLEHASQFKTYHAQSWGLSSGDSPLGYDVFGNTPCLGQPRHNGTVSIWGALACLPFLPEPTLELVDYLYHHQPQTWGSYGFSDAYNLDTSPPWYSQALYGIDKGCSMIMIENYLTGLIWNVYTNSPYIQTGLGVLGFQSRKGEKYEPADGTERAVLAG